jgi:cysteine dioxygenase
MILCWNTGQESPIHDHPNSHCFMKTLQGEVHEELYKKPELTSSCQECSGCKMEKIEDRTYKLNDVAHITGRCQNTTKMDTEKIAIDNRCTIQI